MADTGKTKSCYSPEDIEKWFAAAGAFLAAHADDGEEINEIYWNFVKAREACYPIIYPELFKDRREDDEDV